MEEGVKQCLGLINASLMAISNELKDIGRNHSQNLDVLDSKIAMTKTILTIVDQVDSAAPPLKRP